MVVSIEKNMFTALCLLSFWWW